MTLCECCETPTKLYVDEIDAYLCDNCAQNLAEAAWERYVEDFHDGGSTRFKSLEQQQAEARKLK